MAAESPARSPSRARRVRLTSKPLPSPTLLLTETAAHNDHLEPVLLQLEVGEGRFVLDKLVEGELGALVARVTRRERRGSSSYARAVERVLVLREGRDGLARRCSEVRRRDRRGGRLSTRKSARTLPSVLCCDLRCTSETREGSKEQASSFLGCDGRGAHAAHEEGPHASRCCCREP